MSDSLMIRYDSDDFSHWSWTSLDRDNRPEGEVGSGGLDDLAMYAKGKRAVLVIAGRSLLITAADLPDGNSRAIASAIPYALEEQMAEDVELMHFARGKRQANGLIPVVAISQRFLTDLLQTLANAGIYPVWAVAEPLLIPWNENELSILVRNDTAIVRDGAISGFECSLKQLPVLLTRLCNRDETENCTIIRIWERVHNAEIHSLLEQLNAQIIFGQNNSDFDQLSELGTKRPEINLLQGFEQLEPAGVSSGSWWPAIVLSALAVVVYLGASGYQYYSLRQDIDTVTRKSEELFHTTFPDIKRLVQPLVQAEQKLEQRRIAHGQGVDNLLELLSILGKTKRSNPSITFNNIEYRQGSLVINLEGQSVAQIERFKQQLDSGGSTISEILSTVSKDSKVEARIKIKDKSV